MSHRIDEVAARRGGDPSRLEYFLSKPSLPVERAAAAWEY